MKSYFVLENETGGYDIVNNDVTVAVAASELGAYQIAIHLMEVTL